MSFSSRAILLNRHSASLYRGARPGRFPLPPTFGAPAALRPWQHLGGRRHEITIAGDNKTGHIEAGPNEGIFFFNNLFPLKLQWLFQSERFVQRVQQAGGEVTMGITDMIQKALPKSLPIKITGVIPRFKEGGAFVRFSHDEHILSSEIEGTLKEHLRTDIVKPWWNPFVRVHTGLIRGRPWIEDLKRLPSCKLKVEFVPSEVGVEATELSQEQIYSIFRPYGTLAEITPQPADSKILPKYAFIEFQRTKRAIMAKNCMHGFTVVEENASKDLAKLKISYERKVKTNWIMDWLVNHPRIVIPLLAALAATITVAIFDPIRTFFVKMHITRTFHIADNRLYKWFVSQANDLLTFRNRRKEDAGMNAIWNERKDNIEQVQKWLLETADTFIVVQGPRGSGKRELVIDQALKSRKNTLVVDCKPVQEARGDSSTIDAMALEVGYRPVFSWMNSMSGLIDLAAQGATGMKTGFSETLDSQLQKILNNTATALKEIGLEGRKKSDADANLPEDAYLEAHPESRPVVVIDNFLHKSQEGSIVYDKLAEWAARITEANVAHVIFLTTDVSFSKSLSKALPDRVFRQLSLGDCSPEVAKRYVVSHLQVDPNAPPPGPDPDDGVQDSPLTPSQHRQDLSELDSCISYLGGRLTDLEFLARRIKAGESPRKAVKEIIDQSASEILKLYILNSSADTSRNWTPEQAWQLIKLLASSGQDPSGPGLRYNQVIQSELFKSSGTNDPDAVLSALEQAELISIVSRDGRPHAIKPGKPVFQPAFAQLTRDAVLAARLDLATLAKLTALENATVDKAEQELRLLGELPNGPPAELGARTRWLLKKCQASQARIEGWERESAALKKVLSEQY